ncbi:unnamed protein product [Mytilus edulis]|uniref:Uncharacterized protein n=1 Tax=Mytilus edulis TaxID=6550 RepID=A0A8S3SHL2_MYTED|nr:unnamed protein product [Mytilus edulis]
MASNVVFQQTVNKSGETEFRVKFGRNKSLVFRKHEQFYYLDLYDNKFGKARFNGICLGLDELDFILSIRRDLDSLSSVFPAGKAAEESSHRIQQQEASSRVTTYQPTSTFAYPFPPAPLQPQAVAYKQSAAFIHPSLNAFRQPPPSPPAGSSQQIYECEEESSHRIQQQEASSRVTTHQPTSTFTYPFPPAPLQPQAVAYKLSAAFIHPSLNSSPPAGSCQQIYECEEVVPEIIIRNEDLLTDYIQQTFTPAVKDTEDQIKK